MQPIKKQATKTSSNSAITNSPSTIDVIINNSNSSTNMFSDTSMNNSSSSNVNFTTEEKIKRHVIGLLDDWCKRAKENKNKNQKIFKLQESVDYEIIVDVIGSKVLIRCQCGTTSTLGQKDNSYIILVFNFP
ncbi:unnamed protein product [Rotaria magnacalcarata]|uniref:Uncharacterized protein n=1 Tax=Rotaria magnacalcarata TaxID=392030 RepID=A0A820JY19_9BILA|nr:unnamed protein product [Rotaria magnacalcarata]CAF4334991.1 unnamed protein product [Rotaria magnacalcarata]